MNNRGISTAAALMIVLVALVVSAALAMYVNPRSGVDVRQVRQASSQARQGAGPAAAKTQAAMPKMIELFANWCPPCQKMKPILDDLEKQYKGKIQFVRIDIDKNPDATKKYKVDAIPVQLFFDKNGKQVFRHVGFYSKAEIVAQFKKLGVTPAK